TGLGQDQIGQPLDGPPIEARVACQDRGPLGGQAGPGRLVEDGEAQGFGGLRHCPGRSEEHTSELQSLRHLVCRLLLEKKNEEGKKSLTGLNHSIYVLTPSQVKATKVGKSTSDISAANYKTEYYLH